MNRNHYQIWHSKVNLYITLAILILNLRYVFISFAVPNKMPKHGLHDFEEETNLQKGYKCNQQSGFRRKNNRGHLYCTFITILYLDICTNKAKKDDIHQRTTKFNFLSVKIILQIRLNISLKLQSPLEYFCRLVKKLTLT